MDRDFNDPAYKKLRREVLYRDCQTCQWPGCNTRKRLHVHHIRTWSEYPSLRFETRNCITLCKWHHDKIWGKEYIYETTLSAIALRNDRRSQKRKKNKRPKKHKPKRKLCPKKEKDLHKEIINIKANARRKKKRHGK